MADAASSPKGGANKTRPNKSAGTPKKGEPADSSISKSDQKAVWRQRSKIGDAGAAGGGGVLSLVAMQLNDPWRSILIGISPGLATLFARFSPTIVDWLVERLKVVSLRHTARRACKGYEKFIRAQTSRLADSTLSPENRDDIQRSIDDAQKSLTKVLLIANQ